MGIFSRRDKYGYDRKGYDRKGYDRKGYDRDGIHKLTGTKYDNYGYAKNGFNASGIHKDTGTRHNSDGYDVYGRVGITDYSNRLQTNYDQKISRTNPQLIVILIDQSSSMSELFFSADGEDYSVARTAKHITDKFLYEIMRTCVSGNGIRPYVDLAIIGYGTSIRSATPKIPMEQLPFSVTELQNSYIKRNEIDDSNIGDFSKPRFEWVEEMSSGTTSMLAALQKAKEITEKWIANHRNSFPPMILNITNGLPADDPALSEKVQCDSSGDLPALSLAAIVDEIKKLATTDGNVLLCNALLGTEHTMNSGTIYPTNVQNIDNSFAEPLFEMSSVIPSTLLETGKENGLAIQSGSRLFLYNAFPTSLLFLLKRFLGMHRGPKIQD